MKVAEGALGRNGKPLDYGVLERWTRVASSGDEVTQGRAVKPGHLAMRAPEAPLLQWLPVPQRLSPPSPPSRSDSGASAELLRWGVGQEVDGRAPTTPAVRSELYPGCRRPKHRIGCRARQEMRRARWGPGSLLFGDAWHLPHHLRLPPDSACRRRAARVGQ